MFLAAAVVVDAPPRLLRPIALFSAIVAIALDRHWLLYLREVRNATLARLEPVARPVAVLGHWVPALAFLAILVRPESLFTQVTAVVSGVSAIAMGALWKYMVIVRAAYFQKARIPSVDAPLHHSSSPARAAETSAS